jgi:hypothetical protein
LQQGSFQWVDVAGSQVDTLRFTIDDVTNSFTAVEWQEVIFRVDSVVEFGGYVVKAQPTLVANGNHRAWALTCESYATRLKRAPLIRDTWTNTTTKAIIAAAFTAAGLTEFNVSTYVATGPTLTTYTANGERLDSLLDRLKALASEDAGTDWEWQIRADKRLYFRAASADVAPFGLAMATTADWVNDFPVLTLPTLNRDASLIYNRITVRGGTAPSAEITDTFTGNGSTVLFTLTTQPIRDIVRITVAGTLKSHGVDWYDSFGGSYDVLVNYTAGTIRFPDASPPAGGAALVVVYRNDTAVVATAQSNASYTQYGNLWFDKEVSDTSITALADAQNLADALLEQYALGSVSGTATVERFGIRAGQQVAVDFATLGLVGDYPVRKVTMSLTPGELGISATVNFGGQSDSLSAAVDGDGEAAASAPIVQGEVGIVRVRNRMELIDPTTHFTSAGDYGNATGWVGLYDPATRTGKWLGLNSGALQAYLDSDGKIKASGVTIDATGITVTQGSITAGALAITAGGPNLLLNSTMQVDADADGTADAWAAYNASAGLQPTTLTVPLTGGVDNRAYQRIVWAVNNTTVKGLYTTTGVAGGVQGGWRASGTYSVSWYAKGSAGLVGTSMACYWTTAPATTTWLAQPALTTGWQRYVARIVWGGSVEALGGLYISITSGAAVKGTLDIDHVQVEEADTPSGWKPFPSELEPGSITADLISVTSLAAINADMGSITAGQIVVGSANKLWLNDAADGALNIGGGTKASAPFRVTAAGALTATGVTITGALTPGVGSVLDGTYLSPGTVAAAKLIVTAGGANLLLNSTMQIDLANDGIPDTWIVYSASETGVLAQIDTGGVDNRAFARVSWAGTNTGVKGITSGLDTTVGGVQGGWLANTTYIVSFWAKTSGMGGAPELPSLTWNTAPATTTWIAQPVISATWQRYVARIAWGASVEPNGRVYIYIYGAITGSWDIDHVQVEQADTPSAWKPYPSELEPGSVTADKIYVASLAALVVDTGALNMSGFLTIGVAGGIYQGTGTAASPTTGLKLWNDGGVGRIAGYNATVEQAGFGTDGKLYAGAGKVTIDASGVRTIASTETDDYDGPRAFTITTSTGAPLFHMRSYVSETSTSSRLTQDPVNGLESNLFISTTSPSTYGANIYLQAGTATAGTSALLRIAGGAAPYIRAYHPFVVSAIRPTSDSTTALQLGNAAGTAIVTVDTTNARLGIGATPGEMLHVSGAAASGGTITVRIENTSGAGTTASPNYIRLLYTGYTGYQKAAIRTTEESASRYESIMTFLVNAGASSTDLQERLRIDPTEVVVNEGAANVDFRAETDSGYNGLFVDASNDAVNIMHHGSGKVGFYGATPITCAVLATGASATVDNVISALQALGLVKQS